MQSFWSTIPQKSGRSTYSTYTYMCIYIYTYTSIYICIYIYIYVCTWTPRPCGLMERLSTSRYDFSFTLFCRMRLFVAPLPPTASLHDLRVVERSCGWEGGTRQKRVNEKSYLEVERRSISPHGRVGLWEDGSAQR